MTNELARGGRPTRPEVRATEATMCERCGGYGYVFPSEHFGSRGASPCPECGTGAACLHPVMNIETGLCVECGEPIDCPPQLDFGL